MKRNIRSKQAVSEVIGVVLLLGITMTLFAVLNFYVFHFSFTPSTTSVNLIGTLDKTNNIITIEHIGGEPLEGNIDIIITIGSSSYSRNLTNLIDTNHDNKWNFGETVKIHCNDLTNQYVRTLVVDSVSNTVLMSVLLQQGVSG